jgi:hypothetical protein
VEGLYLITVEALPNPGTEDFEEYGGAFVNVYIRETSEASALGAAEQEVASAGWSCKAVESVEYVTREDFIDDPDGLENFLEALKDGVVTVFHTYPVGPDEDDVVH